MRWNNSESEDTTIYKVVVNHEEQFSIWPADRENALGWRDAGKTGPKAECLAHIKEVWTDMRPLSLRKQMEEAAQKPPQPEPSYSEQPKSADLVTRLCQGDHPVEIGARPENNVKAFRESIDRGYVHIKFTDTKGGTELGVRLDRDASDLSQASFDDSTGKVLLIGGLTLDYVNVRCIADIDLKTLSGKGHLERA